MSQIFHIDQRVSYASHTCTIRYIGPVTGTHGDWLGVEWDDASRGKHSGSASGTRYFDTLVPNSGSFIRPSRPADTPRSFLQAVKDRYAADEDESVNPKNLWIGGKEVQNVGFEKIRKQQGVLGILERVFVDKLCIVQAADEDKGEEIEQIAEVCPSIVELHLSNNLLENLEEVAMICSQLRRLTLLRLDGNRFSDTKLSNGLAKQVKPVFDQVEDLSLESTYLSWNEIHALCSYFPGVEKLWLLHNNLTNFDASSLKSLPASVTAINLGFNAFEELGIGLNHITKLPKLRKLQLHQCHIRSISKNKPLFSEVVTEVDLSYNDIRNWSFIDELPTVFPGLTELIISHNPLFQNFDSPKELAVGDFIVAARLPTLTRLNNSAITPKYRQEAEMYYISLVNQELQDNVKETEAEILIRHPRYHELCRIYEAPIYHRVKKEFNSNALITRMVKIKIMHDTNHSKQSHIVEEYMPKQLSIYGMIGQIGRSLKLSPMSIRVYQEKREVPKSQSRIIPAESAWDSDDEVEAEEPTLAISQVEIKPSPRAITTLFEGDEATVLVQQA
jgi:hypothetical protein